MGRGSLAADESMELLAGRLATGRTTDWVKEEGVWRGLMDDVIVENFVEAMTFVGPGKMTASKANFILDKF